VIMRGCWRVLAGGFCGRELASRVLVQEIWGGKAEPDPVADAGDRIRFGAGLFLRDCSSGQGESGTVDQTRLLRP